MPHAHAVLLRHLRDLAAPPAALSDGQLLERFVAGREEGAFTQLVRRHGPMVLSVCRRLLREEQDAEDAFQATFLVLARRAAAIRKGTSVGGWLHSVARRVAARARAAAIRRAAHETRSPAPAGADDADEIAWREVRTVLDEELGRLPERYRAPLVLCYLEGRTQDEAARQLGWSPRTLRRRLQCGRDLLRARLGRRGLGLSAGLLAVALAERGVVSEALAASAARAAAGAASAAAVRLARGALGATLVSRLAATAAVVVTALALAGGALLAGRDPAAPPPEPERPAPQTAAAPPKPARESDPDSDGDGLTDFQEIHKYLTDPKKKDTSGEGVSDGDWKQRREFTYSVRAVVRVMPPYNLAALNDDYQDVRVLKETKEYAELEVVVYPFNTNAQAIRGNPNWKKDYAGMKEYLAPGVTTNWDDAMRRQLLRELAQDGIDPDKLTDKEVVERVSRWLFKRSQHRNMFCTFYVGFRDGKPEVLPGLEQAFDKDKGDPQWTVQEQFGHELFGKQMFAHKTYGTCTSTAVYQTTVLRALGIPTRMILCIPLADGSDGEQVAMLEKGLTNHRVNCEASTGALGGEGFTSHTFCEVFVGGRWRRLNYTTLGQNVLERNYLGLMIHVHTFNDLSEAKLAETWGARYARGQRDDNFPRNNPYRLLEVGDHFGKYATLPNPPAEKEHKAITVGKAYWADAKDAHEDLRDLPTDARRGDGRFFLHGEEWFEGAGDYLQYKLFMRRADPNFVLRAKGQPDVPCRLSMGFVTRSSANVRELEVVIPAAGYAKMARGVAYTLHPANGKKGYEWKVREGVKLTRD